MSRFRFASVLFVVTCYLGWGVSACRADFVSTGDVVRVMDSTRRAPGFGGGAFEADNQTQLSAPNFFTFCLELNEFVNLGSDYFASVGNAAFYGGVGGGTGPGPSDPLSEQTAYLYASYLANALPSFNVTLDTDNASLQLAIWVLEDELSLADIQVGGSMADAKAVSLYNLANANAQAGNFYQVAVMNLWTTYDGKEFSGPAQSMLVGVPEPSQIACLLLAGVVAAKVGVQRGLRRR